MEMLNAEIQIARDALNALIMANLEAGKTMFDGDANLATVFAALEVADGELEELLPAA